MEQNMSERMKWVSRTLAVIWAIVGIKTAYGLIVYLFSSGVVFSLAHYFWGLIVIALGTALCSFFFWLAIRLWTQFESRHVRLCAAVPAILIFGLAAEFIRKIIEDVSVTYWPAAKNMVIEAQIPAFIGLFAAGICYLIVKRFLFFLLKVKEDIDAEKFRQSRTQYFVILSVFFWSMLMGIAIYFDDKYINLYDKRFFWFPFAALIIPLLTAVLFYKICIWLFVTKPLKVLQSKPTGLFSASKE